MSTQETTQQTTVEETKSVSLPVKRVDPEQSVTERMTDNAVDNILPARYLLKDKNGNVTEDANELFDRVATNVAEAENEHGGDFEMWRDEFRTMMEELRFMPNSPTLMNAGAPLQQLSACFVINPKDDMEDIFEKAKDAALIFQSGGGVGYAFSNLRPKGAHVASTGGEASGPVSFMRVFDETCNQVKQGGKRRGAQMGILRVDHPDIGRFAVAKREEGRFSNFNISAAVTDDFVEAVKNGDTYTFYDPKTDYEEPFEVVEATAQFYNTEYRDNPKDAFSDGHGAVVDENLWRDYASTMKAEKDGETVPLIEKWGDEIDLTPGEPMELPAEFIWDIIIDGAWQNGEPGFFYIDETNRKHSIDVDKHPDYAVQATNPCAEQPLSEYEACNLGHVNLSLMVSENAAPFSEYEGDIESYFHESVDFESLDRTVEAGTRFLDNVVTQSDFPLDEIEERVGNMRKIGLGIMGWAQMLVQMGIPYGSEESYEMARHLMRYIDYKATQASHRLAKERGNFGAWHESKYANPVEYAEWFEEQTYMDPEEWEDGFPMRNHKVTTVAPTGTTSMLANTTGGIEPMYNVANFKNVGNDIQGDDMLVEFDDYFLRTLEANGYSVENIKDVAEEAMRANEFDSVHDLPIEDSIADAFVTTQDLTSAQHAKMQRVFQEFVDSGISKTVNLPNEATHGDVTDAYKLALSDDEIGAPIKGLTVYRDGSRDEQVLTTRQDNKLDGELDSSRLKDLYESDEISDLAAMELGVVDSSGVSIDGALCPECGEEELVDMEEHNGESCAVCPNCFYSPCA